MKKKILIINGSANGQDGQSATISRAIFDQLSNEIEFRHLVLKDQVDTQIWRDQLDWAEGFIFLTGTYWDSWGSPLQFFLEQTTEWEVSSSWLGKPAAVIVTMHSVGGKSVLSRLQGVLNTLGVMIPPLCGLVYSLNTHLNKTKSGHENDFWHLEEVAILVENVRKQIEINGQVKHEWAAWDVVRSDVKRPWLKVEEIHFD